MKSHAVSEETDAPATGFSQHGLTLPPSGHPGDSQCLSVPSVIRVRRCLLSVLLCGLKAICVQVGNVAWLKFAQRECRRVCVALIPSPQSDTGAPLSVEVESSNSQQKDLGFVFKVWSAFLGYAWYIDMAF